MDFQAFLSNYWLPIVYIGGTLLFVGAVRFFFILVSALRVFVKRHDPYTF